MKIGFNADVPESEAKDIVEGIQRKYEIDNFVMAQLGLTLGFVKGQIESVTETKLFLFSLIDVLEGMEASASIDGKGVSVKPDEPKAS